MNKHLDNYLCKKHPLIFAERSKSAMESCMGRGFEHGNGWGFLLDSLCSLIQYHVDNPPHVEEKSIRNFLVNLWIKTAWNWVIYPISNKCFSYDVYRNIYKYLCPNVKYVPEPVPQVVALQVKEKFGTMSFYYTGGDEYIKGSIRFAEYLSGRICENCGTMDESVGSTTNGWIRTLCACCQPEPPESGWKVNDPDLAELWQKLSLEVKDQKS